MEELTKKQEDFILEKGRTCVCDTCGSCVSVEEYHIHPRFMNNPTGDGLKAWVCKSCHDIINQTIIPNILWLHIQDYGYNFVSYKNKKMCIESVKRRTEQWLKEKEF